MKSKTGMEPQRSGKDHKEEVTEVQKGANFSREREFAVLDEHEMCEEAGKRLRANEQGSSFYEFSKMAKFHPPPHKVRRMGGRISILCKRKTGGHSPVSRSSGQDAHAPLVAQTGGAEGGRCLTFRELEALAGAGLAGLFAFLHAGVPGQESFPLERAAKGFVRLNQSAAEGQAKCAGLTVDAAASRFDDDIVGMHGVGDFQWAENLVLEREAREEVHKVAAIDFDGAGAGLHAKAGDRSFAATGGVDGVS